MLITLSRRTAISQSVAEVSLTGVAPLGAVSLRFNFNLTRVILEGSLREKQKLRTCPLDCEFLALCAAPEPNFRY